MGTTEKTNMLIAVISVALGIVVFLIMWNIVPATLACQLIAAVIGTIIIMSVAAVLSRLRII